MASMPRDFLYNRVAAATIPFETSFHGRSCSHRLKKLEKWNRRGDLQILPIDVFDLLPILGSREVYRDKMVSNSIAHTSTYFHRNNPWMGSFASCNDLVFEGIDCKTCLSSPNCEESCVKHEQCTSDDTEKIVKALFLEDLQISSISAEEEDEFNTSMVQELGITLCEILRIHDNLECVSNLTSDQGEICNQKELQPLSLDTDILKGLSKFASILCSEALQSCPLTFDAREGLSCTTVHDDLFSKADTPAFAHPLPTTPKLVSALKGSRTLQGKALSTKLSVKWAPEVYDPPVTSSSHTVKGPHHRHHRPKAKKDYHKHKHIKGKSSRGSVGEKKHAHRRSSDSSLIDPRILRLQALGSSNRPLLDSCGQTKVEALDSAVRSQEPIKCGSSCYMDSLAPVQFSVAEAS